MRSFTKISIIAHMALGLQACNPQTMAHMTSQLGPKTVGSDLGSATETPAPQPSPTQANENVSLPNMPTIYSASAVTLQDGSVLFVGGTDIQNQPARDAQIFNSQTNQFKTVIGFSELAGSRQALAIGHGDVFVLGGKTSHDQWETNRFEMHDAKTLRVTQGGALLSARNKGETVTELNSGELLVAGGMGDGCTFSTTINGDSEIIGKTQYKGSYMHFRRAWHAAVKLNDGRVLVSGGQRCTFNGVFGWIEVEHDTAEIYDPQTGLFSVTGNLLQARAGHKMFLLKSGKILVAGGTYNRMSVSTFELYDPETQTFSKLKGPDLYEVRSVLLLKNGNVLINDGMHLQEYNADQDKIMSIHDLKENRYGAHLVELPDQRVLVAGSGESNPSSMEMISDMLSPGIGE